VPAKGEVNVAQRAGCKIKRYFYAFTSHAIDKIFIVFLFFSLGAAQREYVDIINGSSGELSKGSQAYDTN